MAGIHIVLKHLLLTLIVLLLAACAGIAVVPAATLATVPTPALAAPTLAVSTTVEPTGVPAPTSVATSTPVASVPPPTAVLAALAYSYPIGLPGRPLGDGFFIRHGAQVENTWYNPGYWHTGEDWYAIDGDTAGAGVYAIADGEVVYAGANYPGRVVIVRHMNDLYSMYGHLDPALSVQVGQQLRRAEPIGIVLRRGDKTPDHLHFEIRTFLTAREVNGSAPRYPFRCGQNCPPGPGYWPINAPDVPSDLGWRNPTHTIARRMFSTDIQGQLGEVVVPSRPISQSLTLWSSPPGNDTRKSLGTVTLHAGEHFPLLAIYADVEDTPQTSALAYQLWYQITLPDARTGWVQAAVPSTFETGSDGRPSSVYFNFFPSGDAAP